MAEHARLFPSRATVDRLQLDGWTDSYDLLSDHDFQFFAGERHQASLSISRRRTQNCFHLGSRTAAHCQECATAAEATPALWYEFFDDRNARFDPAVLSDQVRLADL